MPQTVGKHRTTHSNIVPVGTVTGATDGPGIVAIMRHMETLNEYLERRKAVRAELTADDGDNDPCVQAALGKLPPIAPPPKTMLYSVGTLLKKQAD